jgi:TonB family protein
MLGQAGATGAPGATGTALKDAAPSASYAGKLIARIKPNILLTETVAGNLAADVEVRASATGTILSRRLVKSSGNKDWDDAVLRAIDKTEILPRDIDGRVRTPIETSSGPRLELARATALSHGGGSRAAASARSRTGADAFERGGQVGPARVRSTLPRSDSTHARPRAVARDQRVSPGGTRSRREARRTRARRHARELVRLADRDDRQRDLTSAAPASAPAAIRAGSPTRAARCRIERSVGRALDAVAPDRAVQSARYGQRQAWCSVPRGDAVTPLPRSPVRRLRVPELRAWCANSLSPSSACTVGSGAQRALGTRFGMGAVGSRPRAARTCLASAARRRSR